MDPLSVLIQTQGFFTRGQARDAGYDDRAMAHAMRAGIWHRIRRGYYTYVELWAAMDEVQQHLVRSRAVLHSLGPRVALSHVSGALVHGLSTWGVPLARVHATRLDGGPGRTEGDVVHHEGKIGDDDLVEVDGLLVLVPVRCALEAATLGTAESALVHLDSLLCRGLSDPDELARWFEQMARWPHTQHLHIPVRMADGGAHSIGETRGRWVMKVGHLPAPQTQYKVYDAQGILRGTTDWGWPEHRLLGEFDGRIKYGRLLKPGQDPGEVVFAEKQREDLLREITGFGMIRLVWDDLGRPRLTVARIERCLRRQS